MNFNYIINTFIILIIYIINQYETEADLDPNSSTAIQHIDWLNHFSHYHSGCRGNEVVV